MRPAIDIKARSASIIILLDNCETVPLICRFEESLEGVRCAEVTSQRVGSCFLLHADTMKVVIGFG